MFFVKRPQAVQWKNWSESVLAQPKQQLKPKNIEELTKIVKHCAEKNMKMRVVGAGHSFTPLVATSEVLLSLDHLAGIDHVDRERDIVTVWGGTRLKDLGPQLFAHGYAMENLGDINEQSIAGAISTGTHGTGMKFGSLSTQVSGVTMVTASGECLQITESTHSHFLEAVKLSLGMLGIIIKVQLKVVPAFQLLRKSYRISLQDCLQQIDSLRMTNRNVEFFWFPYTKTVQVKTMNLIEEKTSKPKQHYMQQVMVENGLFWGLSEVSRLFPRSAKLISTISALGVPVGKESNESYLLYVNPRLVKFQEMEYSVPAEALPHVIKDIQKAMNKYRFSVHFPIECRYVKGDSIWLSPSYQRDSAYIAVHMYKGMEFSTYFNVIEDIFQAYGGRPHWGKMHTMSNDQLEKAYPKLLDFLQVRSALDENRLFLNEYLIQLFDL